MSITRIDYNGSEQPAEELAFTVDQEGWSSYSLEDGTKIKLKHIVSRVFRLTEERKKDGTPVFVVQGTVAMTTLAPGEVVKVSSPSTEDGEL